ncbi:substrate-binding domain-containing protein [Streptomyces sp. WMMC500]|uniref:substrate-binding domain-containing protein n=1 Tax=Streptomyces sp. WMMC500 TaxID=3015154 RepID=UPI00248B0A0B|nr:substrate-binding domain-containing protein [Streptomyces sp. WMMC500]WBB60802.1 substrate-binding domain-containing protein [Streptomyces sp. WMMC500]
MGRHSLPDAYGTDDAVLRRSVRGRAVVIATALVLAIAGGTLVARQTGLLPEDEPCEGADLELAVVASPDIAPAVRRTAERARRAELKSDGRCLDIEVTARPAAEVAQSLRSKDTRPGFQVWIPDSSIWTGMVTAGGEGATIDEVTRLATSPVGMAVLPDGSGELGWPEKTYGWAELTDAAMGDDAGLRLGTADPAVSATGALALTAMHRAGGKNADTRTAATAKLLAERVEPDDTAVLASLPDSGLDDPRDNDALFLSEQAAFRHNADAGTGGRLDMFYPEGGTVALDYPYAIVNNDAMAMDRVRAASRFQRLLTDATSAELLRSQGFRSPEGRLDAELAMAAGGAAPQPFDAPAAEPPPPDEVASVLGMWTVTVQSARLTTVVDVSGSMGEPVPGEPGQTRMDVTKNALIQALAQFTGEDEIGLWRFSTRLEGEQDYEEVTGTSRLAQRTDDGTSHRERLASAFGALQPVPNGATGLYDTALAAYERQVKEYAPGRFNAVVLLTDGANEDPGSISAADLAARLRETADPERPVGLIAIGVGPDADIEACGRIAKAVGGESYRVTDPKEIHAVLLRAVTDAGAKAALS